MKELIILITRFPRAGESKTRLIPAIGAQSAADLQKEMTEFAFYEAYQTTKHVHVHFSSATKEEIRLWLLTSLYKKLSLKNKELDRDDFFNKADENILFIEQVEGDLGTKLSASLCYANDYLEECKIESKKVLIIGADCPELRKEHFEQAFRMLDNKDFVFCPTFDGGYSLIAFALKNKKLNPYLEVFRDIAWSTEKVFAQSVEKIALNNFTYSTLEKLSDVDYVEDIPKKISVVIPTLNEEKNLEKLFLNMPTAFNVEYIVIDANSSDKTLTIAAKYADKVICSEKGRARQLHKGFLESSGEILMFLHADSLLPPAWDSSIRKSLKQKDTSLVYFDFAILFENNMSKITKIKVKLLEYFTQFRVIAFKLPYGDQALSLRKEDFAKWNLAIYPILEDVYLVKKAKKEGKIESTGTKLYTSYRRWEKYGFLKVCLINQSVLLSHALGMDLEKIKQCYWQGKNPLLEYIKNFFKKAS